jgi:pimeloyl-ACP methyl ester carboxylesterase
MPLPELNHGFLPHGSYLTTIEEISNRFTPEGSPRAELCPALHSLHGFAQQTHAEFYLIGGSFISDAPWPRDVDLILVYRTKAERPNNGAMDILDSRLDIQLASLDEPTILAPFVEMFRFTRTEQEVGICRINVEGIGTELPPYEENEAMMDFIRNTYGARGRPRARIVKRGVLVTIHGIRTDADWNIDVARFGSAQGWTVAPFVYGHRRSPILLSKVSRLKVINRFRDWLDQLQQEENDSPVSVIAHSLGTYIFAAYLFGFDCPPHRFAGVVLANPILSPELDWPSRAEWVRKILHDRAPNDGAVPWMNMVNYLAHDPIYGDAAVTGFKNRGDVVEERQAEIYDHSGGLRRDAIRGRWIPFLNAHG